MLAHKPHHFQARPETCMPFKFQRLEIPDLVLVEPVQFADSRGAFAETYKLSDFQDNGIPETFVQDNWSRSAYRVLRGLHYQNYPKAQGKLVSAARGEILDVAVDLRQDSPTFLRWCAVKLSSQTKTLFYVPPGFAHGFCVLSEEAEVSYKVTAEFDPGLERGVAWNDPEIGIDWPFKDPILSARDAGLPAWQQAKQDFAYKA